MTQTTRFPMKTRIPSLTRALAVLLSGVFLLLPAVSRAADGKPPERMSYQGFLVDANGTPLGNTSPANHTVQFRIYTVSQNGTPIWGESQVVTVDKGYFNVLLGQGSAITGANHDPLSVLFSDAAASDRFIGITVVGVGSGELEPRLQLVSSPYAYLSTFANGLANNQGAPFLSFQNSQVLAPNPIRVSQGASGQPFHGNSGLILEDNATTYLSFLVPNNQESGVLFGKSGNSTHGGIIYDSAANLQFRTGGNNVRMLIHSGGGVGLGSGVTTPTHRLMLQNTASDDVLRLIGPDAVGAGARLNWGDGDFVYIDEPSDDLMTIQANNVGIGGDPASGSNKLQVFGGITSSGNITTTGNMGVGLTSPSDRLHVNGDIRVANDRNIFGLNILQGFNDLHLQGNPSTTDLYINSVGNVGIGTTAPSSRLHVIGDIRLNNNNVLGLNALEGASGLSFRGNPSTTDMFINTSGNVGIGTTSPSHRLTVVANGGSDAVIRLVGPEGSFAVGAKINWGDGQRVYIDEPNDDSMTIMADEVGVGGDPIIGGDKLQVTGRVRASAGFLTSSDRNVKKNIVPADIATILDRVLDLPLHKWSYKEEADSVRHIGPMAQDFRAAFMLGDSDKTIATVDLDGVALSAIQGLNTKLEKENGALQAKVDSLEKRLAELEAKDKAREDRLVRLERLFNRATTMQEASLKN